MWGDTVERIGWRNWVGPSGRKCWTPTRIYVKTVLPLLEQFAVKVWPTSPGRRGGKRAAIQPEGVSARIRRGSWPVPPVFRLIQSIGNIKDQEMYRTFNMGIRAVPGGAGRPD
jgi:phosphoribosylformylglycinamidine cyclo-ligase